MPFTQMITLIATAAAAADASSSSSSSPRYACYFKSLESVHLHHLPEETGDTLDYCPKKRGERESLVSRSKQPDERTMRRSGLSKHVIHSANCDPCYESIFYSVFLYFFFLSFFLPFRLLSSFITSPLLLLLIFLFFLTDDKVPAAANAPAY